MSPDERALIDDALETIFLVASPAPPEREGRISDENYNKLVFGTYAGRLQYIRERLKVLDAARECLKG